MPFDRLKLVPGKDLIDGVRIVEPGVLIGEDQLPEDPDTNDE
jgi:hypothetical protein